MDNKGATAADSLLSQEHRLGEIAAIWSPPVTYPPTASVEGHVQVLADEEQVLGDEEEGHEENEKEDAAALASVTTSIVTLVNTIVGGGTLAMAYACRLCGIGVFLGLMLVVALASHVAVRLLFKAVKMLGVRRPRYPTLGATTYGKCGELACALAITLQQLGACIAYVVIMADLATPILASVAGTDSILAQRWFLQVTMMSAIVFPLCLLPSLKSLRYASILSIGLILFTALTIMVYAVISGINDRQHDESRSAALRLVPEGASFLSALPILSFAFLCHQQTFPIYKELQRPSPRRMNMVSRRAILICASIYLVCGLSGYTIFRDSTADDIFKNFAVRSSSAVSVIMNIVRLGFCVSIVLSYPLMVWEARHNIDVLAFGKKRQFDVRRFFMLNVLIVCFTTTLAIFAGHINIILELVGATCSPLIMYIFPALFYLKVDKNGNDRVAARVLLLAGMVLIPLCVSFWAIKHVLCPNQQLSKNICESLL